PYQYKQVLEPGDDIVTPPVLDTYRLQNDNELTETERKQVEADDQAMHILLSGLPADAYAIMDSCQIANEMWNRIQRNKLTPTKIHTNLKFLYHLQPERAHFVTRVKQSMDLYEVDYNNLYDYLKQNQPEANEIWVTSLAKFHDPLALYSKTPAQAPYALLANTPSTLYTPEQPLPLNNIIMQQLSLNNNNIVKQQPCPFDTIINVNDPMQAMQTTFVLMSKAFTKHYSTPTNNNQKISSNTRNKQIFTTNEHELGGVGHYARNYTNKSRVKDSTYYTERLMLVQNEKVGIPLTVEQHDFLAYASYEEREDWEVNANCILMTKQYKVYMYKRGVAKPRLNKTSNNRTNSTSNSFFCFLDFFST
ncbi:hypothetical protein Tco_1398214, partial [Tanacetum coccineum]